MQRNKKVRHLYDAIVKPDKDEDKCTNFLIWLLPKLPKLVLTEICKKAGIPAFDTGSSTIVDYGVQIPLQHSRPDAVIEADGRYLVIETKIHPDSLDESQLKNHYTGACQRFHSENVWILFLSNDKDPPAYLCRLCRSHPGRIGFISWRSLLELLHDRNLRVSRIHTILIDEFRDFAEQLKLGWIKPMTNKELAKFVKHYEFFQRNQDAANERVRSFLNKLTAKIVDDSAKRVKISRKNFNNELPAPFVCLKVQNGHTTPTDAYVFLNILSKELGIVLVGYEDDDPEAKKSFSTFRGARFKKEFKKDKRLRAFTWVETNKDEGYFKLVNMATGLIFDPREQSDLSAYFYWGYIYNLDFALLESYHKKVPADFVHLLDSFGVTQVLTGGIRRRRKKTGK